MLFVFQRVYRLLFQNHVKMHTVIIGIGSNINASINIPKAMLLLAEIATVNCSSELITTKPIGITDQQDFTNASVNITTELEADELREKLKSIEDKLGRDRTRAKFGPREIDLDIVVFDNEIIDDDYHTRDFLKTLVDTVWKK